MIRVCMCESVDSRDPQPYEAALREKVCVKRDHSDRARVFAAFGRRILDDNAIAVCVMSTGTTPHLRSTLSHYRRYPHSRGHHISLTLHY